MPMILIDQSITGVVGISRSSWSVGKILGAPEKHLTSLEIPYVLVDTYTTFSGAENILSLFHDGTAGFCRSPATRLHKATYRFSDVIALSKPCCDQNAKSERLFR